MSCDVCTRAVAVCACSRSAIISWAYSERGRKDGLRDTAQAQASQLRGVGGRIAVHNVSHRVAVARISAFRSAVWKYWEESGRHNLPWRQPSPSPRHGKQYFDPYKILVSEVMLQQTQVPRVIEKYAEFLREFPTVEVLAKSNLAAVLRVWSGLGYNRRGKYLHDAAKVIVKDYGGKVPRDFSALRALPGIGGYTASAVRVFAYNEPDILIETNIRAVFIHHFFVQGRSLYKLSPENPSRTVLEGKIGDNELLPFIEKTALGQDPRTWNWALMDYGSHLKKLHKNPARKSAHYVQQSKFEGSLRQVRGEILRVLKDGPQTEKALLARCYLAKSRLNLDEGRFQKALDSLVRDGLIAKTKGKWQIS